MHLFARLFMRRRNAAPVGPGAKRATIPPRRKRAHYAGWQLTADDAGVVRIEITPWPARRNTKGLAQNGARAREGATEHCVRGGRWAATMKAMLGIR